MPAPLVVAFELGVTPGKWARVWHERMPRQQLDLRPASAAEALDGLRSGVVHAAFLRDPMLDDDLLAIRLYEERPVVVVPRGHAVEALDPLEAAVLADLADENVLDPADPAAAIDLVAANVGVVVLPQSVARALSRKDVVARSLDGVHVSEVAIVWTREARVDGLEEFLGVVRGRTANSSRDAPAAPRLSASQKAAAKKARRAR